MMRQALRRAMACFLLAAVLSTAAVIPASAAGFRDVPSGHWAAESIERCVSLGFFQGKSASQFGMGEEMTRSAFAVVLCRFFGGRAIWGSSLLLLIVFADLMYADRTREKGKLEQVPRGH